MSKPNEIELHLIREVDWGAQAALSSIRTQVFIIEQGVTPELEWDGLDEDALHLLAFDHETPVGCARILANGIIGRMAVLESHRGKGIGLALLKQAIACCHRHGWQQIKLSAQIHALQFYQREGFKVCSEEYLDAGIPHRDMELSLSA
jgi:predicted GNAT family N-acyltransferase